MLLVCRREASKLGIENVDVAISIAEHLAFRNGSFDGVTCRMGAHHFGEVKQFLKEVRRVLKPGGWLLLVDTIGPEGEIEALRLDQIERLRDPSHRHDFSPKEWRGLFLETGFEIQKEEGSRKTLEAVDWMNRTSVPHDDRRTISEAIQDSDGALRDYFDPRVIDGLLHFDLHEHAFFAKRT